jgi:Tol biopolymer transport system component
MEIRLPFAVVVAVALAAAGRSPESARISFTSDRDGNSEVYVMDADGSNPTLLTASPAQDAFPA